jgi:hypothetical protein
MEKIDQSRYPERIGNTSSMHFSMHVNSGLLPLFFQLLGSGFIVNVSTSCSVKELLCGQLGIHEEYLEERIQTLFLNAKVVDDVNTCIVNEGSTLALSGALPGLAGATLRRGGFYASLRSQISHDKTTSPLPLSGTGKITLKLFNLVVKELGPVFLQNGILIKGQKLKEFIARNFEELNSACKRCRLDDNSIDLNKLLDSDLKNELIFLQIDVE